jgi:hypothetical protein
MPTYVCVCVCVCVVVGGGALQLEWPTPTNTCRPTLAAAATRAAPPRPFAPLHTHYLHTSPHPSTPLLTRPALQVEEAAPGSGVATPSKRRAPDCQSGGLEGAQQQQRQRQRLAHAGQDFVGSAGATGERVGSPLGRGAVCERV